jgi:hypothetical protein
VSDATNGVALLADHTEPVRALVERFGLTLALVDNDSEIPGSYWGAPEAGLIARTLYARVDTPLHSVLHEMSHVMCMDDARRAVLHTDAGGDAIEECAVCYLSILLADAIHGYCRARMFRDMDAWGYSFRLGGARSWFEQDADDARAWLLEHDVVASSEPGALEVIGLAHR